MDEFLTLDDIQLFVQVYILTDPELSCHPFHNFSCNTSSKPRSVLGADLRYIFAHGLRTRLIGGFSHKATAYFASLYHVEAFFSCLPETRLLRYELSFF